MVFEFPHKGDKYFYVNKKMTASLLLPLCYLFAAPTVSKHEPL